jgi:membrane protein YqaA with SNARE-associated domain
MGESPTTESLPAEVELRLQRHEPIRFRAWFYPFVVWLVVLAGVKVLWPNTSLALLAAYVGYMSICCTFCPLPTTPVVLWMAAPAAGGGLGMPPLAVAALGAVGTAIANMHDYYLLIFLYRYKPVRRVRTSGLYQRFAAWYNRAPFATLAAASFLPIPVDFVRLLAISEGYNRAKFAIGSLVGRWPRYLALAYMADRFNLGWQWILGIGGAIVVLGLWRGLVVLARRRKGLGRANSRAEEETTP